MQYAKIYWTGNRVKFLSVIIKTFKFCCNKYRFFQNLIKSNDGNKKSNLCEAERPELICWSRNFMQWILYKIESL